MPKKIKGKKAKLSVKKKRSVPKAKKPAVKKAKGKALKKAPVRKAVKVNAVVAPSPVAGLEQLGEITHYFPHVNAGVVKLTASISNGQEVYIKGHTTDFKQKIESMQIDRAPVDKAKPGDEIGILVSQRVRGGDKVYRV